MHSFLQSKIIYFFYITLFALHLSFTITMSNGFAMGTDGYFYLTQIQSLANQFTFYFKDYSLSFLLPAFLAFIFKFATPQYALLAFQTSCSISFIFCFIGVWKVVKIHQDICNFTLVTTIDQDLYNTKAEENGNDHVLLIIVAIIFFSMQSLYEFNYEHLKNFIAITLFIWSFVFAYNKRFKFALFLFLCSLLSHKSILILFALLAFRLVLHYRKIILKKKILLFLILGGFIIVTTFLFYYFQNLYPYIKAMLWYLDWPTSFFSDFSHHVNHDFTIAFIYIHNLLLLVVFLYILSTKQWRNLAAKNIPIPLYIFTEVLILLLLFTLHPFQRLEMTAPAQRFLTMATPLSIILTFQLYFLLIKKSNSHKLPNKSLVGAPTLRILFSTLGFSLFLIPYWAQPNRLLSHFKDYSKFKNIEKIKTLVAHDQHLMTHHGLNFFIHYHTGLRARNWTRIDLGKNLFRVVTFSIDTIQIKSTHTQKDIMNFEAWYKQELLNHVHKHIIILAVKKVALLDIGNDYYLLQNSDYLHIIRSYPIMPLQLNTFSLRKNYLVE